jgi:hypothetical protein
MKCVAEKSRTRSISVITNSVIRRGARYCIDRRRYLSEFRIYFDGD